MSMTARDLKGSGRRVRKKLLQFVGALRVAETIAKQDHPGFDISCLPGVQEMIGGSEGKHVTRV